MFDIVVGRKMMDRLEGKDQSLDMGQLQTKRQQIENAFTYHPPKGDQTDRYEVLTSEFKKLAHLIVALRGYSKITEILGLRGRLFYCWSEMP